MAARIQIPVDPLRDAEFDRAFELLRGLVDGSAIDREFSLRENAVDITSVVLWRLVSQWRNPAGSLEATVQPLMESQHDFLPRNKRVLEQTLSAGTGSYRRARSRLPRRAAEWFAQHGPCDW